MQKPDQLALLRDLLSTRFDDGELRSFCVDLGVDYENLPGATKRDKARELVAYMGRRGRLDEVVALGCQERPGFPWPDLAAPAPAPAPTAPAVPAALAGYRRLQPGITCSVRLVLSLAIVAAVGWLAWPRIRKLLPPAAPPVAMVIRVPSAEPGLTPMPPAAFTPTLATPGPAGAAPGSRLSAVQVPSWSGFADVRQLAWLPGSRQIALAGDGVSLYDLKTAAAQKLVDKGWSSGLAVVASWPGGSGPGIATFDDAGGAVYDSHGAKLMQYPSLKDAPCLAVSPDGRRLAVCFADAVRVFDVHTGQVTATLAAGQSPRRAAFSPDGKLLAVGGSDVKVFDLQGDQELFTGLDPGNRVESLAFSPDSNLLATAGQGGLRLWDVPGRRSLGSLADGPAAAPAFSADGRLLAAAAAPALIKVWDVATRQEMATITGHTGMPAALAFAGDCASYVDGPGPCLALLASGGSDGFRLWRLANAAPTRPAYATGIPPTRLPNQGGRDNGRQRRVAADGRHLGQG